ncbi:MAG: gliding motility-associated ABC transporter substrate-binding protein GldG [Bacteroidia bacterium]
MVEKKKENSKSNSIGGFLIFLAAVFLINTVADRWYKRFDLTKEKRYTLSESTKNLLDKLNDEVYITVYLDGELPIEYKRLKTSVKDMLNEYRYESGGNVSYNFEDILADRSIEEKREILQQLHQQGLKIEVPELADDEVAGERYIVPSAMVVYRGREYPLNFLKREFGKPLEQEINGSIELLEYEIGNVLRKCIAGRELKLAIVEGHGELGPMETADIAKELSDFYRVERISINLSDTNCIKLFAKEVLANPERQSEVLIESLIKKLNTYQGIIIAKPTIPFKEVEKFILDQYVMNGGKVIWLVESLIAEMDSIASSGTGRFMTANHAHNLDNLLFNYGARVEATLVQDLQSHGIQAINRQTNRPDFKPWWFYPLFNPADDNMITRNLESVWGRFCSTIDTTANRSAKKTILLKSSKFSRVAHNPVMISLDQLEVRPDENNFRNPGQISAVLLEGGFRSAFKYRPGMRRNLEIDYKDTVEENAMIVIGDGDLIRNQISTDKSQVYPLGYDKFGSQSFGQPVNFANKKFFLNCVDYLCDESNIIEVRSKEIVLRLLDKERVREEKKKWQWINMGLPILIVVIFGGINAFYRRRKWQ